MGGEVVPPRSVISSVYLFLYILEKQSFFKNYLFIFTFKRLKAAKKQSSGLKKHSSSLHETARSIPRIGNMIFASAEKILSHVVSPHTSNKNKSSPTIQDSPTRHLKKTQVIQSCHMLQRPLENTQRREHSPTLCPRALSNRRCHLQLVHSRVWTVFGSASSEEVAET